MALSGVADLTGRVLAGRYRLLSPIGAGASGRVYAADDITLRRRVAVKVLHAALAHDEAFLRRFRAEAQLAASLHHPNLVAVYDWGEDDVPFMVLELLDGGSLRSMLDAGVRLTPAQAAYLGREACRALEYAHARGLVHRDVKPANILFDEHGVPRIADFGLARALAEASVTEPTGAIIGTARYAAPEQAAGMTIDGRADLYALAIVLTEGVTGNVPLVGDTPIGTLAMRNQLSVDAPPELGPLGVVIERAGRSDPADRYPDAATMGAAIGDAAAHLPPPGPLALAGHGVVIEDPNPTNIASVKGSNLFDQDAVDEIEVVETKPIRRQYPWVAAAVVGLAVVLALVAAAIAVFAADRGSVAVPNFVGGERASAADDAARLGFAVRADLRSSDDPLGTVLGQSPRAGALVGDGATITLLVSSGPPPVPLPSLAGEPEDRATEQLAAAGFLVKRTPRFDEVVKKGVVIDTDPPGAKTAPRDSVVTIVVSDGPAPVPVPDVVKKSYDEAAAALSAAGFTPVRADVFDDNVAAGIVVSTAPAATAPAVKGTKVTVNVSKGPELVAVPNVVGLSVEAASSRLTQAGLVPDVSAYGPGKRVVAQAPSGGQLKKGATVRLFL